jgi:RNA-directed DNA polymerase
MQNRKGNYPNTKMDFLGYTFRPRVAKNSKTNAIFVSFTAAVSAKALKAMSEVDPIDWTTF